jgi:peptide deformylase
MSLNKTLVNSNDQILYTKIEEFDFNNPPVDPVTLSEHMIEMLDEYNGLGLAANQLGLPYRVFAMRTTPRLVCFNPIITFESPESIVLEEGCLTFPGLYVKIKRPSWIRVRFTEADGNVRTEKFTGITARCFLHEFDHLEGIHYLSRASRINLDRAKRQKKLFERKKRKAVNKIIRTSEEVGNE